jgi:membrane-bound ClpP family serine protease
MESASEKVNSALRADFANRARLFDRNPLLAEAMVDKDMILVWRNGKIVKLDHESQIRLTGIDQDQVITAKGKLLTLDAEQMKAYKIADLVLTSQKLLPISDEERAEGKWSANKVLLFHTPEFSKFSQATIDAYQMDWKTQFFAFLATPLVSSLLLMGLMVGGYIELNHPGLGLPGIVAIISLVLMILSNYSLQIANWLEVVLLLMGLSLILIELFILPSFGVLGIVGIFLFFGSLFALFLPGVRVIDFEYDTQTLNVAGQYMLNRLAWFIGTLLVSGVIIILLAQYMLPKFGSFNKFVLKGFEQEGYIAGESSLDLPQPGVVGKSLTPLKPAGKIIVQEKIYDALSNGTFIEAGESIMIARLEGSVVVVISHSENSI